MSSTSEPVHLSNHHRNTLRQIFEHPVSHNVEWRTVVSLLEAVGSVVERHDGKVAVTVVSQTEFFDPPPHKDIDTQAVVDLRRMLSAAGYSTASTDVLLWLTRSCGRLSRPAGVPGHSGASVAARPALPWASIDRWRPGLNGGGYCGSHCPGPPGTGPTCSRSRSRWRSGSAGRR